MTAIKRFVSELLPPKNQIWPVFAIIVFIDFSWVLYRFFFQVPSWLYYMRASNLLILLVYTLSFALIESLLVLGLVLILCMIMPGRFFRDNFIPQGSILVFVITLIAFVLRQRIEEFSKMESWILIAIPLVVILVLVSTIVITSLFLNRFSLVKKWISTLAVQMTIFLYVYPPLGIVSLLVVVVRNIFI